MQQEITGILALLRELKKIDPEFPLQYALCLTEIAQSEGISLTALAKRTAMPLSTVSRIIGALSKKRQKGRPFDLVRVTVSPAERRKKELYLTPRGYALIRTLAGAVATGPAQSRQLRD